MTNRLEGGTSIKIWTNNNKQILLRKSSCAWPFRILLTLLSNSFSSFLESRGQPLLDLSLYVSSENYTEWTRPALAQILEWPNQWVVPHRLRDEAKKRSEHLGLSSLDIETASKEDGDENAMGATNIPKHLVAKPKETVTNMLGKRGHQNQFRLDAITSDFFEPLCELVEKNGSQSWVFGTDQASSLDCLLLGYMSLMCPPLTPPCKWLQDALSTRYPALWHWTTNFRQECFGGPISAADVVFTSTSDIGASHGHLPWQSRSTTSLQRIGLTVLTATLDFLPVVSRYRSDRIIRTSCQNVKKADLHETGPLVQTTKHPLRSGLGMVGTVIFASLGYFFYAGLSGGGDRAERAHSMDRRRNTTSQRDFGEAGRILGVGMR